MSSKIYFGKDYAEFPTQEDAFAYVQYENSHCKSLEDEYYENHGGLHLSRSLRARRYKCIVKWGGEYRWQTAQECSYPDCTCPIDADEALLCLKGYPLGV